MADAVGQIMDRSFAQAGDRVETLSMKLDQQRAAVTNLKTEVGEKLAPIYMSVTKGGLEFVNAIANTFEYASKGYAEMFRSIGLLERQQDKFGKSISETGKKRIESEEKSLFQLNAMLSSLQDNNLEEDQRRILINKINTEYKDYLPNLLSEKQTLEDIRDVAREVNQTARERINQIIFQEKINKATQDGVQAQKDLNELTVEQSKMKAKGGLFAMTSDQIRKESGKMKVLGHAFRSAASSVIFMEKRIEDARDRLIFAEMTIDSYTKKLNGLEQGTNTAGDATGNLGDTFEKTRNEAFFYTEAIHRLREAHSMLYKAQGAQLQPMVEVTRQLSQAGFDAFTAFEELGNTIGTTLSTSFEAAMISGEDFFKVFIQGLKNMLAQLLAAVAAALVLAALLVVITGGGIGALSMESIGTAFKHFTGPMMGVPSFGLGGGLGGAMQGGGGIEIFGRLSGSDILVSTEKANRERSRYTFG
jgi:predicted transcriptional regulator